MATAVTEIELKSLEKVSKGKIRDIFKVDDETLLFVTSDRISAFDVVMKNGIPNKGAILTLLSAHWFRVLADRVPGLRTHLVTLDLPASGLTDAERALIKHRSMQVRRLKVFPIEAIVRGRITGSAWAEYQRAGTVHGIPVAPGLREGQAFPRPLYTPSTKAELGAHDENIHPSEAARLIGDDAHAARLEELALAAYAAARDYAAERGIVIADTKFEFALDEAAGEVVLADEVLTPDSSRFWPADAGREGESFDKQPIRDWLTREGLKGKEGVELPEEVCRATEERYKDAFLRLTGRTFEEAVAE